ncbi:extracellular catalytic domain type 1 short-chain-length polyhydroxyalkanoate depolymerase [Myceligenerans xiligouense]|uniref:Poly(Hydroxyalkanoate) depolymerase family esterase n=1 Tax=Myceligenerans xiligouense TaxID=253184 RepID=A0A3N4YNF3_9MICO|nr:PHB depolymerase family esterase [Myceligenerans xiligouense]RPF21647.1 poly(hydroxyalkanoate) depolymerase family esterase [Myceligenerans xiligouense]
MRIQAHPTRRRLLRPLAGALVAALALTLGALGTEAATRPASAASLQQVTDFGPNPSGLNMYVYVPDDVDPNPALLVAVHYCTGSAPAYFGGGAQEFVRAADEQGFVIVFPEATRDGHCFDVYSPDALTRDGGSDPVAIRSMIAHATAQYGVDTSRIYATGVSSGAMMTNVLLALYPDVFAAGAAFAGVPATCFATGSPDNTWNSTCSNGQDIRTAPEWGDAARGMYPGYAGPYPRFQTWHGTQDTVLAYPNFGEQIKQWTDLHGLAQGSGAVDQPQQDWTRTTYGDAALPDFQSISLQGYSHDLYRTGMAQYAMDFFGGLDEGSGEPTPTPTPTPTDDPPPTPTPTGDPTDDPTFPEPPPGTCEAALTVVNAWQGGYQAEVTVTATNDQIHDWLTRFTLSGSNVSQLWNGDLQGTTGTVTVGNVGWNGRVTSGQSTTYGFIGSGTAPGTPPEVECFPQSVP